MRHFILKMVIQKRFLGDEISNQVGNSHHSLVFSNWNIVDS